MTAGVRSKASRLATDVTLDAAEDVLGNSREGFGHEGGAVGNGSGGVIVIDHNQGHRRTGRQWSGERIVYCRHSIGLAAGGGNGSAVQE